MDMQNAVMATITVEEESKKVLLSTPDFLKRYVLNCGHGNEVIVAAIEKLMNTATHWNDWVELPVNPNGSLKARLCMDKDMLEEFLIGEHHPDKKDIPLCVKDCSPECIAMVHDYGYNFDGTYIRDMWKDVEAALEKSSELVTRTATDGKHKFFEAEVFPCMGDSFSEKAMAEICESEDIALEFTERVEEFYLYNRDDISGRVLYEVKEMIEPLYPGGLTDNQEALMQDIVDESIAFKYPFQHFLDQEVDVDITVDTGDGNYDFVLNTWTPAYGGETEGEIDPKASIRWLAETQGYSEKQLRETLMEGDMRNPHGFLESMRVELANCVSHMNALVFLVKMTFGEYLHLQEMMKKQYVDGKRSYDATQIPDCGSIKISKNAHCGLYDGWNGGGSVLEIELEKDLELPVKFIDTADPDLAHSRWAYCISRVYGIPSSCWTSNAVTFVKPDDGPNGANVMLCA